MSCRAYSGCACSGSAWSARRQTGNPLYKLACLAAGCEGASCCRYCLTNDFFLTARRSLHDLMFCLAYVGFPSRIFRSSLLAALPMPFPVLLMSLALFLAGAVLSFPLRLLRHLPTFTALDVLFPFPFSAPSALHLSPLCFSRSFALRPQSEAAATRSIRYTVTYKVRHQPGRLDVLEGHKMSEGAFGDVLIVRWKDGSGQIWPGTTAAARCLTLQATFAVLARGLFSTASVPHLAGSGIMKLSGGDGRQAAATPRL